MTYIQIIAAAAKAAHISAVLLTAIASHESKDFELDYALYDAGSPSYSIFQLKEPTARMLGYKGPAMELRNANIAAKYAAQYIRYQMDRYGDDWCMVTAAYNSGTFIESEKKPGYPKNLKYVRLVQAKLPKELQYRLNCGKIPNNN